MKARTRMNSVGVVRWGVREGSSVYVVADGPTAFRVEREMKLARRQVSVVVCSPDIVVAAGEGPVWVALSPSSVYRPDPAPPAGPRRRGWWEMWVGRGWWLPRAAAVRVSQPFRKRFMGAD